METKTKPTLDEVLKETEKKISYWLFKRANKLPQEQKDEIKQIAMMTIFQKYGEIEAYGWKSWLNDRCRGFVMDYQKQRKGFISFGKKLQRVDNTDSDGDDIPLDNTIQKYGLFDEKVSSEVDIKWDILAKLASKDLPLRAFVKNKVLGITLEVLVPHFNLETTRVNQLVQEFASRFEVFKEQTKKVKEFVGTELSDEQLGFELLDLIKNDSNGLDDYFYLKQCCFALGLCKTLDIPDRPVYLNDSKSYIGQHLDPIDLWDETPSQAYIQRQSQMTFFEK